MARTDDTIAAIATPAGRGGIGVVRVSGPACVDIARGVLGERPSKSAATIDADRLGRLVSALALLFRDEKTGSSIGLLDALAKTNTTKPTGPGLEAMLVSYARALREQGKPDQADLCLLGAMLVAVAAERPPPDEAIAATDAAPSELGWALRFAREVYAARKGKLPDSTAYAAGMRGTITVQPANSDEATS